MKGVRGLSLLKLAADQVKEEEPSDFQKGMGMAAAGTGALMAGDRLLPYQRIYHGTSKANADQIKQEGLRPDKGGTGVDGMSDIDPLKGKSNNYVHATAKPNQAAAFAAMYNPGPQAKVQKMNEYARQGNPFGMNAAQLQLQAELAQQTRLDKNHAAIVRGRVPLTMINRADIESDKYDPATGKLLEELPDAKAVLKQKLHGFRTNEAIPPEALAGSNVSLLNKLKYQASHLPEVAKAYPGRLAGGAGLAAAGAGLIGYGGYRGLQGLREEPEQ